MSSPQYYDPYLPNANNDSTSNYPPLRQDTHPVVPGFVPPTNWQTQSSSNLEVAGEYPPGARPAISVQGSSNRYDTLPLNDPDQDDYDARTLVDHGRRPSDVEKGSKIYGLASPDQSGSLFLPDTPIDPRSLSPAQKKVYKGFDNEGIDKIDRNETAQQRWARWKEERREMGSWNWFVQKILDHCVRKGNWKYVILFIFVLALAILSLIFSEPIAHALEKPGKKIKDLKFGWAIPIGIYYILSFPPLFGAELLSTVVGLIWPLIMGWGLVSAGTILGELTVYWIFRALRNRIGEKFTNSSMTFACLSKVVAAGGFWIALLVRYSAFPTHLSTVMFGLFRTNFWAYAAASILSLPRWLPHVYNGVYLHKSGLHELTTLDKVLYWGSTVLFGLITYYTWVFLGKKMTAIRPECKKELRIRRAAALNAVTNGSKGSPALAGTAIVTGHQTASPILSPRNAGGKLSSPPAYHARRESGEIAESEARQGLLYPPTGIERGGESGGHRRSGSFGSEETYRGDPTLGT